jgi:hypothetical protein
VTPIAACRFRPKSALRLQTPEKFPPLRFPDLNDGRVAVLPDTRARAPGSRKRTNLRPWSQGDDNGLCGLFATINAIRWLWPELRHKDDDGEVPSMGAFQALEWGINYPDAMKGLMLIVPGARSDRHVHAIFERRRDRDQGQLVHGFGRVRDMRKVVFAIALGLVCQGCFSREAPEVAAAVSPVNPEVEAARLIRTLDISTHLQDSARNYAAKETRHDSEDSTRAVDC